MSLRTRSLAAGFEHTARNFQWDEYWDANRGRVIEIVSENCSQAFMQDYTLVGRITWFPSYNPFLRIVVRVKDLVRARLVPLIAELTQGIKKGLHLVEGTVSARTYDLGMVKGGAGGNVLYDGSIEQLFHA
jgi:hypothetical protein